MGKLEVSARTLMRWLCMETRRRSFVEMGNAQMAGRIKWYSFLQGLES